MSQLTSCNNSPQKSEAHQYFSPQKPITEVMVTPTYINEATRLVTSPRKSVELSKSGRLYLPTVRKVVRELGAQGMETCIKLQLVNLNLILNLPRPMNNDMITATAPLVVQHILDDDCDLNLADLRIIFDRAKKGVYGSFYGGIGCADIIGWIDGYIAEKCNEYERWHQNEYNRDDPYQRISTDASKERDAYHEAMAHYIGNGTKL